MRTEKKFLTLYTNHMNMSAKKYPHLTSPIKPTHVEVTLRRENAVK